MTAHDTDGMISGGGQYEIDDRRRPDTRNPDLLPASPFPDEGGLIPQYDPNARSDVVEPVPPTAQSHRDDPGERRNSPVGGSRHALWLVTLILSAALGVVSFAMMVAGVVDPSLSDRVLNAGATGTFLAGASLCVMADMQDGWRRRARKKKKKKKKRKSR